MALLARGNMAAALGKPVWLLNCLDPCWRRLVEWRDSPRFPGLRLYQPQPGDWDTVIAEVAQHLRGFDVGLIPDRGMLSS